jgi:hypothetical protein
MCIIETDPSGLEWVASHYIAFMHRGGHISFGDGLDEHSMAYYDILDHQCVPIEQYDAKELIKRFEQWIDEGYYIIVDANLGKLIKEYEKYFKKHEMLLYGYDEQKRVFYSLLQNEKNEKFEVFELEYDAIPSAIESIIMYYRENPMERFAHFYNYFYPLTKLRIRPMLYDDNMFILKALKKLEAEYYSDCHEISRYGQTQEMEQKFVNYTGLGCLIGMKKILIGMIEGNDPSVKSVSKVNNLFKLYEHRCILRSTLELLREKLRIVDTAYNNAFETYCSGIASMRECYLLMEKAHISGKNNSLPSIIQRLDTVYENDYNSLRVIDGIAKQTMIGRL